MYAMIPTAVLYLTLARFSGRHHRHAWPRHSEVLRASGRTGRLAHCCDRSVHRRESQRCGSLRPSVLRVSSVPLLCLLSRSKISLTRSNIFVALYNTIPFVAKVPRLAGLSYELSCLISAVRSRATNQLNVLSVEFENI